LGNSRNSGISRLAGVFDERIRRHSEHPALLDYGTLGKSGTLKADSFPEALDKNDYGVLEHCRKDMKKGEKQRVLVAWVGDDPVIVGILSEQEAGDG